ncbi:MAG: restriction endonuclease subunit S [Acidimicrobiaceae bacterium]|nr:restriction endonuclease subunit S [Acidimicrobiaceae bacterium]MYB87684.1 restriction endonuclease subunit S [Acidimicrobiaceae bacterium]MYH94334.1 restriction endonuclease subunit S [Acidimicrobiaceae bacterium]
MSNRKIGVNTEYPRVKFRYLASVRKGRLPSTPVEAKPAAEWLPYLTMEYLRREITEPLLVASNPELLVASDDDVLLLWDGSNAGEFLLARRGVVASTVALITPSSVDSRFFYWACKAREYELKAHTSGMGIPHVSGDVLANLRVPMPTRPQQQTVADYLDHETATLDALIRQQDHFLELLDEKRRVLIANAVLRGLDPDVPLRDSGIPWIGYIPAHWKLEKARWLCRERDERSISGEEELLTVSHLTGVTPRSEKNVYMFEAETTEGYKVCHKDDLVVNTLWAWMGAMGVTSADGIVSPAYHIYEIGDELDPSYMDLLVRLPTFAQEVTRHSKGVWSSRLRLYPEGLFNVTFPVPPIEEQQQIVSAVVAHADALNQLMEAVHNAISLLSERRSSLISAAVTGQIEVEKAV